MHPVLRNRNNRYSISVPLSDAPDLLWVRLERLQPTCRTAGIEYANGLEGWERSGRYNRPLLDGIVIARSDVEKLAEAIARSSRGNAISDAAAVVLELVWEVLPASEWQVHTVRGAMKNPARVAVWADALERTHPDFARLLRRHVCPDYPATDDPIDLFVRAAEAAGWPAALTSKIGGMVRSGENPDVLHRASALLSSRGKLATENEIKLLCRRQLDDTPY